MFLPLVLAAAATAAADAPSNALGRLSCATESMTGGDGFTNGSWVEGGNVVTATVLAATLARGASGGAQRPPASDRRGRKAAALAAAVAARTAGSSAGEAMDAAAVTRACLH